MRKLIASVQMSLDGFISGPKGEMDWLVNGEEEWIEMLRDLESVDTVLVGRKMYPDYAAYWQAVLNDPSGDPYQKEYARFADKTPHIVFSNSLTDTGWQNARIAKDPESEVTRLKQQPGRNLVVWGGATMISELISLNLVDELRIALSPVVLGGGLPMFRDVKDRNKLKLIDTRPLKSGVVLLRYQLS